MVSTDFSNKQKDVDRDFVGKIQDSIFLFDSFTWIFLL